jgi:hypothetical protein
MIELGYSFIVSTEGKICVRGAKHMADKLMQLQGSRGRMILKLYDMRDTQSIHKYISHILCKQLKDALYEAGNMLDEQEALEIFWRSSSVTRSKDIDIDSLDFEESVHFISDCKRLAAEYLNKYID